MRATPASLWTTRSLLSSERDPKTALRPWRSLSEAAHPVSPLLRSVSPGPLGGVVVLVLPLSPLRNMPEPLAGPTFSLSSSFFLSSHLSSLSPLVSLMLLKTALALGLLVVRGRTAVVDVHYDITYTNTNHDGLFERRAVGVNGVWPPPPLVVTRGDFIKVTATNRLGDMNIGLHHHGMFFKGTPEYDGAPGINQCGTPPNASITHGIDTSQKWGSYWYHSHIGVQSKS